MLQIHPLTSKSTEIFFCNSFSVKFLDRQDTTTFCSLTEIPLLLKAEKQRYVPGRESTGGLEFRCFYLASQYFVDCLFQGIHPIRLLNEPLAATVKDLLGLSIQAVST